MKTAVIGLGNIGSKVAANLAAGGESVIVSQPNVAEARELAQKLVGRVEALPVEEALAKADVIVLALWFNVMKEFVAKYRNTMVGKIVVDPSNPIAPNGKGGFDKIIPVDHPGRPIVRRDHRWAPSSGCGAREGVRHGGRGLSELRREPQARACGALLRNGFPGGRPGGFAVDHCERFRADERRWHQQVDSHRGLWRPQPVQARQARVREGSRGGGLAGVAEAGPRVPRSARIGLISRLQLLVAPGLDPSRRGPRRLRTTSVQGSKLCGWPSASSVLCTTALATSPGDGWRTPLASAISNASRAHAETRSRSTASQRGMTARYGSFSLSLRRRHSANKATSTLRPHAVCETRPCAGRIGSAHPHRVRGCAPARSDGEGLPVDLRRSAVYVPGLLAVPARIHDRQSISLRPVSRRRPA